MESLGWEDSQVVANIASSSSCLWSNINPQQQHHASPIWSNQENLILQNSSSNSCLFSSSIGNKIDLSTHNHIFDPIQYIQKPRTSERHQETTRVLRDGIGWVDASTAQELYAASSPLMNNFVLSNRNAGVSSGSLESLDCLLSGTNSKTDTSVEDDGISVIFSECRNLLNFAVSLGESENKETPSPSSSDKKCFTKRRNGESEVKQGESEVKLGETKYPYFNLLQKDKEEEEEEEEEEGGFKLITEHEPKAKRFRSDQKKPSSSNINFQQPSNSSVNSSSIEEPDPEAIAQMKEMIYRAAAFRPVNLGLEIVEKPKRKNVRISTDPQTVAARQRRERISERIRVLQRLVPGGNKMDTASMLDEAANYLKFLRSQVKALEKLETTTPPSSTNFGLSSSNSNLPFNNHSFNLPMQTQHHNLHHHHFSLQNPSHTHPSQS